MIQQTEQCAHSACNCPARADNEYCSDHCATHKDNTETGCQCGHPECQAQAAGAP